MFCPKCGNEIQEKHKFCAKCGYKINDNQDNVTNSIVDVGEETSTKGSNTTQNSYIYSPNKTKHNKKVLIIAIPSAVLALLILCAIIFFTSSTYRVYKDERVGESDSTISDYSKEVNDEDLYDKAIGLFEKNDFENALKIFLQISDYKESSDYIKKCQVEIDIIAFNNKITALKSAKIGETVIWGKYEQNNKIGESEDIEWIVLNRSGDYVTLMTKKYIDAKVFNTIENRGNWSTSTLRQWLNGDFIKAAFSDQEQKYLHESSVSSIEYDSNENAQLTTTKDKAYILSIDEYEKYSVKKATATEYTQFVTANYLYAGRWNYADDEICWLRDVGHGVAFQTTNQVRGTDFDGSTLYETEWPNSFCYCVQPVITICISND